MRAIVRGKNGKTWAINRLPLSLNTSSLLATDLWVFSTHNFQNLAIYVAPVNWSNSVAITVRLRVLSKFEAILCSNRN